SRKGIEAKRTLFFSPTCTINGILTGYTGPGSKTVLPKEAMAKLDFRLVSNQTSDDIRRKLARHLRKRGFKDIEVTSYGSTEPVRTPVTDTFVSVVTKAAERVYRKKAVIYPTSAASGPMHLFRNILGAPVVSAGCSHADPKTHAPNENLTVEGFITGTKFIAKVLEDFSHSK
ncbi:MAG: M20/M25/M40 family metallo-hydrolase, partial [Candidatus Bathyarchaeota archaeon]|nr:M20/M25/M40 family metallo-hydrolase [Candidatus Bathyarchaeota archaeon]